MPNVAAFIDGFARFRKKYFEGENNLYDQLRLAQTPKVLVIACCDSRVDPAILLDSRPGEIFVIRNVANLVPPHAGDRGTHGVSAALEFAVCSLQVSDIIVLGHSQCGGIQALLSGAAGEYISQWMDIAREAAVYVRSHSRERTTEETLRACEQRSIIHSLHNLQTFPWIRDRVASGSLTIRGWYFNLASGDIEAYDRTTGDFRSLLPAAP